MKVGIIGTGYVGLTTGVALAYLGHKVTCLDIDQKKLDLLRQGRSPIYEPWLQELMSLAKLNLNFNTAFQETIPHFDVVFITVGTPSLSDGGPNLNYVRSAAENIGKHLGGGFTVIVNKSTVPIG